MKGATSRTKTTDTRGIGRILEPATSAMGVATLVAADSPLDDKPAETDRPVVTGLGKKVDALLAMSPTLSEKIRRLQRENWTIDYSPGHRGSYSNSAKKVIHIEQKLWVLPTDPVKAERQEWRAAEELTAVLAHEACHATDSHDVI